MKRVKAACICQTLHFMLKDDLEHDEAVAHVRREVEQYRKALESRKIRYKIVEQLDQPDGSIVMKIIRQYNVSPVGDYLD